MGNIPWKMKRTPVFSLRSEVSGNGKHGSIVGLRPPTSSNGDIQGARCEGTFWIEPGNPVSPPASRSIMYPGRTPMGWLSSGDDHPARIQAGCSISSIASGVVVQGLGFGYPALERPGADNAPGRRNHHFPSSRTEPEERKFPKVSISFDSIGGEKPKAKITTKDGTRVYYRGFADRTAELLLAWPTPQCRRLGDQMLFLASRGYPA